MLSGGDGSAVTVKTQKPLVKGLTGFDGFSRT